MPQPKKVAPERTEVNQTPQPQVSQELVKSMTFDDLVVDGSLPAVKVRLRPVQSKPIGKKAPGSDDELLIELQCEV